MLIYVTNRRLKNVPKSNPVENKISEIESELNTKKNSHGDSIYCGIKNESNNKFKFYPRGEELDLFKKIKKTEYNRPWIVLLHGFHQDVKETLLKARFLEKYGINVVLFSWPSRPKPVESFNTDGVKDYIKSFVKNTIFGFGRPSLKLFFVKELNKLLKDYMGNYVPARKNARASTSDFHAALTVVNKYLLPRVKDRKISLVTHSMGNYLLERTILDKGVLPVKFSNIILHQADVRASNHVTWVPRLLSHTSKRLYITVNIFDYVLAASNILNRYKLGQENTERLGQSVRLKPEGQYLGYINNKVHYLDFTDGYGVDTKHEIFTCDGVNINDHSISAGKNEIDKSIVNLLKKIFKSENNDGLPNVKGESKNGMSKMKTIPNVYRPKWIVEDESLCDDDVDICFIDSIEQFDDPYQPEPIFDPELDDD